MAKLIAVGGELDGQSFDISGEIVMGRAEDVEVVVPSPRASRRHARAFKDAQGYIVEDLKSKNGTYVNDRKVPRHVLADGDEIHVGEQKFVFQSGARPRPRIAPPAPMGGEPRRRAMLDSGIAVVAGGPPVADTPDNLNLSMRIDLRELQAQEAAGDQEDMRRSHERLRTMIQVSNSLSTIHDLDELLEEIMRQLFEIFPQTQRGFIMLADEATGELKPHIIKRRSKDSEDPLKDTASGETKVVDGEDTISISTAVIEEVLAGPNAVLSADTMSDDRFSDRMSIVNLQIRSMMCVPLVVRDEVLGILHVDTTSRSKSFTQEDLELLTSIAAQAAISIKNASLMDQVQKEAATRGQLQRYLSPDLVDRIQLGEMSLDIGGDMKHGTVFFSDIIGFTRMSEQMPPSEVVALLNRYFHIMEEIIFRHGGTIDKFGGDSIMAFWGVLVSSDFDALGAVSAAVEMQNALFAFNCELESQGHQAVRMGIGLNTGDFVAGNIGSEQKIEFTVIGDAVNVASRIESLAGRGQVLISPSTYEQVKDEVMALEFPPVNVKNKSEPVGVFNVRAIRPPAVSGRPGVILAIPVAITPAGGGDAIAGQVVWGRSRSEKIVELELVSEANLERDAKYSLMPSVQGMPGLPEIAARVLYAAEKPPGDEEARGGGAVLLAEDVPPEIAIFLNAGTSQATDKSLEDIGRA